MGFRRYDAPPESVVYHLIVELSFLVVMSSCPDEYGERAASQTRRPPVMGSPYIRSDFGVYIWAQSLSHSLEHAVIAAQQPEAAGMLVAVPD